MSHTYGPTCRLGRKVSFSGSKGDDDAPVIKAQFFYSSPLPIDDPLSVVPTPTGSESKSVKHPLRPFSAGDNDALEEAWLSLSAGKDKKQDKKHHKKHKGDGKGSLFRKSTQASASSTAGRDQQATHGTTLAQVSQGKKAPSASAPSKSDLAAVQAPQAIEESQASQDSSKQSKPGKKLGSPAAEGPSNNGKRPGSTSTVASSSSCPACPEPSNVVEPSSIVEAPEIRGNPYNSNCDDSHHIPLDTAVSPCCEELETNVPAGHQECIIDVKEVALPQQSDKSTNPDIKKGDDTTNQQDVDKHLSESKRKEYRAFDKHEQSKGHREFEKDLKNEHEGHLSEPHGSKHDIRTSELLETHGKSHLPGSSFKAEYRTESTSHLSASVPDQEADAGITGKPFVKLPSRKSSPQRQPLQTFTHDDVENQTPREQPSGPKESHQIDEQEIGATEVVHVPGCKVHKKAKELADVPVGISRLHLVKLPSLQMQPIYWSPVHDEASVIRGTWFYKDTMYPVEPAVANQLEFGYRELRCFSKTWHDELNSAMEVGAAGEEKIAHRLWPKDSDAKTGSHTHPHLATDPHCAARCFNGEVAAEGTVGSEEKSSEPKVLTKKYSNAQVIYKDAQNAFILKPTLQPSAYYGRKPLQKIMRNMNVGIHVVRGFDWKAWNKLRPSKKTNSTLKTEGNAPIAGAADASRAAACPACRSQENQPKVTDLCLVVHGIGQKLSERVESFHFTHAMNAFRRNVTAERVNDAVQKVLREDLGGIMVLPVNWRSNLSFDDGDSKKGADEGHLKGEFSLEDITQPTIPAVRSMISDVMLDIPFYMSHHKPKMIQAVISEANRVYRLWCKNNPEFHQEGRVHIIAHSLGSVMAVEILSKQPTSAPKVDFNGRKFNTKCFDFNTTNLFFAGSPAGFFFYLEKAKMLPRRGRGKPGAERSDEYDKKITGEVGSWGCMAVDNVYNIMHYNDPIAYRLNATVDQKYAASLKTAQVPSATTGFFESIGKAMRSITPGVSSSPDHGIGQVPKPGSIARLPSQLEMEVHDFTSEEIAERKMVLLNDNGQVDFCLSSGGGPLEIQYINMLGAHSSYWTSHDFVRMIVIEVGRKPGRASTLPNMRATKIGHKAS
ncbi:putative phospholipase [Lachnellula suecica]|uniref:Putative phospholipase n=1 Tax=Lachnellula suecica TaxID=602035 RepID=A0A8T9CGV4_9HELO|nr:putative phospholipase [Lachnellula suecica]